MSISEVRPGLILLASRRLSRPVWFDCADERELPVYYFREVCEWEQDRASEIVPLTPHKQERLDEIVSAARELAGRRPVAGVVAFHDFALPAWAAVAAALDLPGPDPRLVETLADKSLMRAAFDDAALPSARSIPASSWDEVRAAAKRIGYPVVVKPSGGAGSWGVVRVNDELELVAAQPDVETAVTALGEDVSFVVEEYLAGAEVTVDAVISAGRVRWQGVAIKPSPMEGPSFAEVEYVTPTELPVETLSQLKKINEELLFALPFSDGVSHTEYRLTTDGPRLLETHARCAGQQVPWVYRASMGIDLVGAALDCAVGREPQLRERTVGFASFRCVEPPRAGVVQRVDGVEQARALVGVEDVVINVRPGDPIAVLPAAAQTSIGYIFAKDDTYAGVREITARAEALIQVEIEAAQ